MPLVQTGFPAGDASKGEKGFAALPDKVEYYRSTIAPTLDYVEQLGCRMVHPMAGVRPAGVEPARLWDTYLENLAFAADAAKARGMTVIVEPIGPGSIANYVIDDPQVAVDAIEAIGRDNVKLLFDAYHCVCLGHDPAALIRDHAALIAHVQIADDPGRHEPGRGRSRSSRSSRRWRRWATPASSAASIIRRPAPRRGSAGCGRRRNRPSNPTHPLILRRRSAAEASKEPSRNRAAGWSPPSRPASRSPQDEVEGWISASWRWPPDAQPSNRARRSSTAGQTSGLTSRGGVSPLRSPMICSAPQAATLRRASWVTPAVW